MARKTAKRGLRKYTAFVPKTVRATTNLGKKVIRGATSVLDSSVRAVRQGARAVNKASATAIRSLTRRRGKKTRARSRKHHKKH